MTASLALERKMSNLGLLLCRVTSLLSIFWDLSMKKINVFGEVSKRWLVELWMNGKFWFLSRLKKRARLALAEVARSAITALACHTKKPTTCVKYESTLASLLNRGTKKNFACVVHITCIVLLTNKCTTGSWFNLSLVSLKARTSLNLSSCLYRCCTFAVSQTNH